jgi:predicted nucleotidyltransferase
MGEILEARRKSNQHRLETLSKDLPAAEDVAGSRACVYLTGSFGRGEASTHSDLDLFIVGNGAKGSRQLPRLDEICIKADLIETTRRHKFPEFSGDGEYLVHHSTGELIGTLGKPEDDASNTFTARLLLLLESRPLLCEPVYKTILGEVVAAYWRDYEDHKLTFMPAFLANDILRLWRTFCINYEARTQTDPVEKKAKRKLTNYKLRHSRLLTCYSALLFLLYTYKKNKTVHPSDVLQMVELSPTSRLEWLASDSAESLTKEHVSSVLKLYERFLEDTDKPESQLVQEFLDRSTARAYQQNAHELGDKVYNLMSSVGGDSAFFRLLVV